MTARLILLDRHLAELRALLLDRPGIEGAAFLLCGESRTDEVSKLVSHAVVPIAEEDFLVRSHDRLSISSRALSRISKLGRYESLSIIFAHSHPQGLCEFSAQDDNEENVLLPFLQGRVPERIHGTIVITEESIAARLYVPGRKSVDAVLSVGSRIQLLSSSDAGIGPTYFDRQIRAFGTVTQSALRNLRVGIVGVGGTGSAVAEQLYRLGVGHLTLFDGDRLEDTNLNRVFGSRRSDIGEYKVDIAKRHLDAIDLGPVVRAVPHHITQLNSARELPTCDVIFGCTDKEIPRGILIQVAIRYAIPVFDMGVLLDSVGGNLRGVHGRVTTLLPGEACLLCRGRISAEGMRIEGLSQEDRANQIRNGYAPELPEPAPAVIPFTSSVASFAVAEFLHRMTGFMGSTRLSSELMITFDQSKIRTNRVAASENCVCSTDYLVGRGDESPFLGMMWSTDTK
jgi:hypothetical protein